MAATLTAAPTAATAASAENFQRYYEEAGPDYAAWSPNFNMHFGFFRWGMNPFSREAMLEQMNREVLNCLRLNTESARILDMGCGLGATLRSIARQLPAAQLQGITLVPWQLQQGRLLNESCPNSAPITLTLGDYQHTAFASESFDALFAIESSCYATGTNKSAFLHEAHRLLRPGGRIVVADGFLGPDKLRGPQKPSAAPCATAGPSTLSVKSCPSRANSSASAFATLQSTPCRPASHHASSTSPGSRSNSCSRRSSSAAAK